MKSLTSIEISAVVKELKELEGSKVRKLYQPDNTELLLELFKTGFGKALIRVMPGTCLYLTSFKRKNPKQPLSFCKFLRKRLTNVFLEKIEQKGFERIVEFTFQTKENKFYLIAEFFSKGNLILCDENYRIISALQVQLWKDRKIKANEIYQFPPKGNVDIFNLKEDEFRNLVKNIEDKSIVKVLAVDIGLGGFYAEELCLRAEIDKDRVNVSDEEISRLFRELKIFAKLDINPFILENDAVPFDLMKCEGKEGVSMKTFNEALDKYYKNFILEDLEKEVQDKSDKKLKKQEDILKSQTEKIEEMTKAVEFNKDKGDLIYKNYIMIKEVLDVIQKARDKKVAWKEIEEKLKTKGILVNGKEGEVTLELK